MDFFITGLQTKPHILSRAGRHRANIFRRCRYNGRTYLASSERRLGFVMEDWPDVEFRKTWEHHRDVGLFSHSYLNIACLSRGDFCRIHPSDHVDHHAAPVFHDRDDISSNGRFSGTPVISSAIPIHGPESRLDFVLDIYCEYMTSTLS